MEENKKELRFKVGERPREYLLAKMVLKRFDGNTTALMVMAIVLTQRLLQSLQLILHLRVGGGHLLNDVVGGRGSAVIAVDDNLADLGSGRKLRVDELNNLVCPTN